MTLPRTLLCLLLTACPPPLPEDSDADSGTDTDLGTDTDAGTDTDLGTDTDTDPDTTCDPPDVTLTEPAGNCYDLGASVPFAATASDPVDAPTALLAEVTDSIDGTLSTDAPDGNGSLSFARTDLSEGAHTVTVTITNTCDASASDQASFDVQCQPSAASFTLGPAAPGPADDVSVQIDPDAACPDVLYSVEWSVNSTPTGETGATLSATQFEAGDTVTATVAPIGGCTDVAATSQSKVIGAR